MRDPFDRLCDRLGNHLVGLVAVAAVCGVLWICGGLK